MPYTKEQRRLLQAKQEKIQVRTGVPLVGDLSEGVPVLRSTDSGVYQYVRHNSTLYKVKLDRVSTTSTTTSSLLNPNGYIVLSNGLIIMWGTTEGPGDTETLVFADLSPPLPDFPNNCFQVVATAGQSVAGSTNVAVWDFTATGFGVRHGANERPAHFTAIGN